MKRIYEHVIKEHLKEYRQMLFLSGPRQVGKTTLSHFAQTFTENFTYLNWDNSEHKRLILKGPKTISEYANLEKLQPVLPIIVFDEIHKYRNWKSFLKGFFDTYQEKTKIIVTGSSKLDVFRKGQDSLMGRYFLYRIHPISSAECERTEFSDIEINQPTRPTEQHFETLLQYGGFPEPFLKHNTKFFNRWKALRRQQLFREDLRDLTRIQELNLVDVLAEFLKEQAGQLVNYSNLANKIGASVDSIRRWIQTLEQFYYCFTLKPWRKNISRSLLKEPKIYLWDWSELTDLGAKAENFVAAHLLKAVQFWTDRGLGNYGLYFLRDKEKREVDFVITKDEKPWFLVEVKHKDNSSIHKHLYAFQKSTQAKHAFQVAVEMEYVDQDCFAQTTPTIVPAKTFLSQLI